MSIRVFQFIKKGCIDNFSQVNVQKNWPLDSFSKLHGYFGLIMINDLD